MLLTQDIQSPVAADREEPLGQMIPDRGTVVATKAHERVLHHVASRLCIAHQARGIDRQRPLEMGNRFAYPRTVLGIRTDCHHHPRQAMRSPSTLLRADRRFLRAKRKNSGGALLWRDERSVLNEERVQPDFVIFYPTCEGGGRVGGVVTGRVGVQASSFC